MIVDSSALIAIIMKEPDGFVFFHALSVANPGPILSSPTFVETAITIERKGGNVGALERLLREAQIGVREFTPTHAVAAWDAFRRFGRGRHPAQLNFGDCMTYGFAEVENRPLLFKGTDFAQTDIRSAISR